jgi:hypothetical protein
MDEIDGECVPENGDPVAVTVPGRIWQLCDRGGVAGAFVSAGGSDYWIPLTDLLPENNGWTAFPPLERPSSSS